AAWRPGPPGRGNVRGASRPPVRRERPSARASAPRPDRPAAAAGAGAGGRGGGRRGRARAPPPARPSAPRPSALRPTPPPPTAPPAASRPPTARTTSGPAASQPPHGEGQHVVPDVERQQREQQQRGVAVHEGQSLRGLASKLGGGDRIDVLDADPR